MTTHPRNLFFKLGIFGTIQFLILVHLAMWFYAGGTLHEAGAEGYSFTHNFFSDLGRTHTFSGARNVPTSQIFRFTMSVVGICFVAFFFALPGLFRSPLSKGLGIAAAVFGVLAGLCYFGIAQVPYNVDYWGHR
ncbi:MAG: hypothetical protein ACE5HS_23395, partial [bacterium]